MKIAVLSTVSRNAGGLFYSVRWLSQALASQGCEPTVFSPTDEYTQRDLSVWDPLPVELYSAYGPMQSSFRLRSMLVAYAADVIHLHGIWLDSQWAAMQHQKRKGVPVVVSPRGMLDPWAVSNSGWKKKIVGALFANESLAKANCIHALCASEADSVRKYGLDNPVVVIPNGVELPELGRVVPNGEGNRKRKLLFLGRIHPKKGLYELIEAWGKGHGTWREECQLLIAGWDDRGHVAPLKSRADELGLDWAGSLADLEEGAASLAFLGSFFGKEKDDLMRRVDGFILPSFSEGLPMAVLEAWSYALPVLMTPECNIPEGFDADAALKIKPDVGSIIDGIRQWVEMGETGRKKMGTHGRMLVEEKFTWDKIARQMKSVYEDCVSGRGKPS